MDLHRSYTLPRHRLQLRCRTQNRWLTGCVTTTRRRLADLLNSEESSSVLVVDDAVVELDGQETRFVLSHVNLSTSTILFAMPIEDTPRPPDIRIRSTRRVERMLVGVGPYEIEGDLYRLPESRPREVLASISSQFIVLAEAIIRPAGSPDPLGTYEAVLVNRQHIEFIGLAPGAEERR